MIQSLTFWSSNSAFFKWAFINHIAFCDTNFWHNSNKNSIRKLITTAHQFYYKHLKINKVQLVLILSFFVPQYVCPLFIYSFIHCFIDCKSNQSPTPGFNIPSEIFYTSSSIFKCLQPTNLFVTKSNDD